MDALEGILLASESGCDVQSPHGSIAMCESLLDTASVRPEPMKVETGDPDLGGSTDEALDLANQVGNLIRPMSKGWQETMKGYEKLIRLLLQNIATYVDPECDGHGQRVLKRLGEMNNIPLTSAPSNCASSMGGGGANTPSTQHPAQEFD